MLSEAKHLDLPTVPISELADWSAQLSLQARQPLELCPEFPQIARRFEAWWNHDLLDRPIILASADRNPARPMPKRLELLEHPDRWLAEKRLDLAQTHHVGDVIPSIRVDFGPVMLGGLLGAKVEFQSDTTWTHPLIDDEWSNAKFSLCEDNRWWQLLRKLTDLVARDAAGRYLVRTPDLGGSADVLLNLRGSEKLCLDILERPQVVADALDAIYPIWRRVLSELYRLSLAANAGIIHWLGLWSNRPYMIPACDFNFMIGRQEFDRICLPDIARQTATVGRAVFHLDGPGAARHIDSLLEVPHIDAIQFTPGTGTPSAIAWLDMYQKIQAKGRSLLIVVPVKELPEILRSLRPEGLAIILAHSFSPAELDEFFANFTGRWRSIA